MHDTLVQWSTDLVDTDLVEKISVTNHFYSITSKMRFTNNRLTGLQTDKTWLGLSRLSRVQQLLKKV